MPAEKIILFDGECNLCNSSVNFIIDRDQNNVFKFASLQSETGQSLFGKSALSKMDIDSIILVSGDRYFTKSSAVLRIAKELNIPWKLFYAFIIIPFPLRDFLYDIVARNRYKWFGKKDSCRIPTPELKNKFL